MAKVKRLKGLDCSAPADKMVRLVLGAQLKSMCSLRAKALDWDDPEGVHDMRVFSRRLRSAISDFKPHMRKSSVPLLKLKAIANSLGAVRDEDVAIAALEELKSTAQAQAVEGIEMLAKERQERRKAARAALKDVISRSAIKDFRKEFLNKINSIEVGPIRSSRRRLSAGGALSFAHLGVEVVNARLKDFNFSSRSIYSPFEIKEIHELRILAKRLRYAIELFAVCWGEKSEQISKEISFMQDSLGKLHDCDVWIEGLGTQLVQTARGNKNDEDKMRLAQGAVWLLSHFSQERADHYRDALVRWQQWEVDGLLQELRMLVDSHASDHTSNLAA